MTSLPLSVGMFPPVDLLARGVPVARDYLEQIAAAGIDHVCCGDHVSFGGIGFDGLVQASALAMLHPTLPISCGVYLLPLRHPVLVARQLADLQRIAPGRFVFGVGVGGEDPREVAMCGVNPRTRGRRMDECLAVLRGLRTGAPVDFHGSFFELDGVAITPATDIPIVIGGRSDAALRRAGRFGDGWLGIWNSPRRFADAVSIIADESVRAGRTEPPGRHGMQVWCGFATSKETARASLAPVMEAFYRMPFDQFERYCPYGAPEDVAAFLAPYVEAGARDLNLIPQSPDDDQVIAGVAEVRRLLS